MRDAKARVRTGKLSYMTADVVKTALCKLRESGMLRDGGKTTVKAFRKSILSISCPDGVGSTPLPYMAMQEIAFNFIQRKNDVARAFKVDKRTVGQVRNLVAAVGMQGDNKWMAELGAEFDRGDKKNICFVTSLSADATTEQLMLPM